MEHEKKIKEKQSVIRNEASAEYYLNKQMAIALEILFTDIYSGRKIFTKQKNEGGDILIFLFRKDSYLTTNLLLPFI